MAVAVALAVGCSSGATSSDPETARLVSAESPFAGCPTPPAFENGEVEPSLAADPRNPRRLVAVYQQDRFREGGGSRGDVVAVSSDGGRTWKRTPLPLTRCAGGPARFASDPWVSVGPDGRIYISALSDVISVVTSTDWGATWSAPAVVSGPGLTDKESITADPHRPGTAYLVWSDYRDTQPPGTESDELLSITHDGGRTWSRPRVVLAHAARAGPGDGQILADPGTPGRLYLLMAWVRDGFVTPEQPATMMIARSEDGGEHWTTPERFGLGTPTFGAGPAIRSSPQVPSFAIDSAGALYAVWQDNRFTRGARNDVLFTSSTDGGRHWSRPRSLSGSSPAGAILPTVAAGGEGRLAILYLSLRGAGSSLRARWRVAGSDSGGESFSGSDVSASFDVTDVPQLKGSPLVPGGYFLGDYMGVAPLGAAGFGVLFTTATGETANPTDVFYLALTGD